MHAHRAKVAHYFQHLTRQTVNQIHNNNIDGYDSCVNVLCIFSCQTINGTELIIK